MDQAVQGKIPGNPRILVAPLDWGLGHATRCIPLIRELEEQGAEVIIAGEGPQNVLLKNELPGIEMLELQGYRVRYGKTGFDLLRNLLYQTPGILRAIREENTWLRNIIPGKKIDGVISDNRYGLYTDLVPCIFMTHQLAIKTPWGSWTDQLIQRKNYSYIEKFSACWVPDAPGPNGLAGELSHPKKRPRVPLTYIGPLSRFKYEGGKKIQGQVLILISGPEPQRTAFEEMIMNELEHTAIPSVIVRGLPGETKSPESNPALTIYNHIPASSMAAEIQNADLVIARSGYSTIMDLARMKKKALLIPTPGQTEQLYLANYLMEKKQAWSVSQSNFSLAKNVNDARKQGYTLEEPVMAGELKSAVRGFLELVKRKYN
jgi:uncharacterized protein (TIGR00661 family)